MFIFILGICNLNILFHMGIADLENLNVALLLIFMYYIITLGLIVLIDNRFIKYLNIHSFISTKASTYIK